ncbi:hypothetical protein [Terrisporobacter glycolicus]|uniref:hypothetical protein n=1 Tax=Terrisporobacter glycolicus TaxID=36841 RepID=UPI0034645B3E
MRNDIINKNKNSEFLNKITKQIFEVDNIDLMKQLLEDEVFYEKILKGDIVKLHNKIKLNKLTSDDFINEYNITGHFGFVSVCQMLEMI